MIEEVPNLEEEESKATMIEEVSNLEKEEESKTPMIQEVPSI